MSRPISSLPELRARIVAALPPLAHCDGEALAAAIALGAPPVRDPFLVEIFSRLLAVGIMETREEGNTLSDALGLGREDLRALTVWIGGGSLSPLADAAAEPVVDEEEEQVLSLLRGFAVDARRETRWVAAMIARRAMRPNHLWQDLGLADRSWLNEMLRRFFPELHAGNTADMKWKKYFYRRLCELEGFTLCTAPSCRECCDFDRCFGAEDGQSLLARARLEADRRDATAVLSVS